MIPLLCVILFAIIGTWILIDPTPSLIILNFPEFIGRLAIGVWFWIVTIPAIFQFHVKLIPITSIIYYANLFDEVLIMGRTPLGKEPEELDD